MSRTTTALIVIAIILIASIGTMMVNDQIGNEDDLNTSAEHYMIEYVLNGGTNSEENPTSYTKGDEIELCDAVNTDMLFTGWYLDAELTGSIEKITPDMTGNLTLYAGWTTSLVGHGFTLDIDGELDSFPFDYAITGESTYKYISTDGENYFINRVTSEAYSIPGTYYYRTFDSDDSYWSNENDDEYTMTQLENRTINTVYGEKDCEVYEIVSATYIQYEYIGDGWIPYLIEYKTVNTFNSHTATYTLKETFTFKSDSDCSITVFCDEGITVTGTGTYSTGSEVTLIASTDDTDFAGWYDENENLLSSNRTYIIDQLCIDTTIYALNDVNPDRTIESGEKVTLNSNVVLDDTLWYIYDDSMNLVESYRGDLLEYTFYDAGFYTIEYKGTLADGTGFNGYFTLLAKGVIAMTYEWTYDGDSYECELDIDYEDYMAYKNSTISRSQGSTSHDLSFITYNDPYVLKLAEYFKNKSVGMTELEVSNFLLTFTQYIEYQLDSEYMGTEEYWKYPLETLFEHGGDCEDTAILYCAIAKAMGMDVAFILLPGHAIAGIAVDGCDGYYFVASDRTSYYYCETTTTGWEVGDNPNKASYNNRTCNVIPVV